MLEELNRAGADIKEMAAKLEAKVKEFFGGDHDISADTTDHVQAISGAVDDHIQAVTELEADKPGVDLSGGNPPQPSGVADTGAKPMVDGANQSAASAAPDGAAGASTGAGATPVPETVEPQRDPVTGLWVDAEGKTLEPQPEVDPATGKPVIMPAV